MSLNDLPFLREASRALTIAQQKRIRLGWPFRSTLRRRLFMPEEGSYLTCSLDWHARRQVQRGGSYLTNLVETCLTRRLNVRRQLHEETLEKTCKPRSATAPMQTVLVKILVGHSPQLNPASRAYQFESTGTTRGTPGYACYQRDKCSDRFIPDLT